MELLHNNNVIHETNVSTQLTKAISIDDKRQRRRCCSRIYLESDANCESGFNGSPRPSVHHSRTGRASDSSLCGVPLPQVSVTISSS